MRADAIRLGQGWPRLLRAGLLVALTVLVSLGGHVLAGGTVQASAPVVLGVLALGAICVAAADTRRGVIEILPVVLLAQPVLHLLVSMGAAHSHAGASGPAGHAAVPSVPMLLAHATAAVVVSVLLAHADTVVWALAGLARRLVLPVRPSLVVPTLSRPAVMPALTSLPPCSASRAAPPLRRGPPRALVAL